MQQLNDWNAEAAGLQIDCETDAGGQAFQKRSLQAGHRAKIETAVQPDSPEGGLPLNRDGGL